MKEEVLSQRCAINQAFENFLYWEKEPWADMRSRDTRQKKRVPKPKVFTLSEK